MRRTLTPPLALALSLSPAWAAPPSPSPAPDPASLAVPAHPGAVGALAAELEGIIITPEAVKDRAKRRAWTLRSMKGQVVLVNFWASWCAPCTKELPVLADLHRRHEGEGFQVVAISLDQSPPEALAVRQQLELPFTIVADPKGIGAARFGVETLPASLLFDHTGRLLWRRDDELPADDPALKAVLEKALSARNAQPPK